MVTIVQPSEANIRVDEGRDDRWLYSAGAVVGLAVLFGILAVVSVAGGDGTARRGSTGEEDDAEAGPLAIHEIGSHQSIAG
jgi:hypothetical protein